MMFDMRILTTNDILDARLHKIETWESDRGARSRGTSHGTWLAEVTASCSLTIAMRARSAGIENAFDIHDVVPETVRPLFCEGRGSVPLGCAPRRSQTLHVTDAL